MTTGKQSYANQALDVLKLAREFYNMIKSEFKNEISHVTDNEKKIVNVVAFRTKQIKSWLLADALAMKGWMVNRLWLGGDEAIGLTITLNHTKIISEFEKRPESII